MKGSLFLVRRDILYFCKEAFIKWRGTKDIVKTSETLCVQKGLHNLIYNAIHKAKNPKFKYPSCTIRT